MYTDGNFPAPLAIGGFLALCGGLLVALVLVGLLSAKRDKGTLRAILGLTGLALLVYFGLLFGFSLGSHQVVLAEKQEKYFCEIDCHLAYSVQGAYRTRTIEASPQKLAAHGWFYVITLRTRFDPHTISPTRGDGALRPSPRLLEIRDADGHSYGEQPTAEQVFAKSSTDLLTPLGPGQSYNTTLVFDLPENVREPRLLVMTKPAWADYLLIGLESSFLHQKVVFKLD